MVHGAWGLPARGARRQERGGSVDSHFLAAVSAASRIFGGCLPANSIEIGIAGAAGLGDDVPFDRLGRIGRHAAPGHQDARQPVLRDRAAALRRDQQQPGGGGFVLGDAVAVELRDGVFDHGVDIAGDRGEPHQPHGLGHVLRHAAAFFVHGGERVLRFRVAGIGGLRGTVRRRA